MEVHFITVDSIYLFRTSNSVRTPSAQYQHTQQKNIKSDTVYLQTYSARLYSMYQLDCHVEAYKQYLLELSTHFI
jgi:hypothetical protein